MKETIALSKIRLDGGTQPRATINTDVVSEYAERIEAGDEFPAPEVFFDGADYWLADGFHRYHGYAKCNRKKIECSIRKGTVREAILFAVGANGHHGLRRTNADKRKAVETLLKDTEWAQYSDRKVAEICCVGHEMVGDARRQLADSASSTAKRIGKDGKARPSTQPPRPEAATTSATVSYPFTCPNCGGHSQDEDGDCGNCCEPAEEPTSEPEPEPEGGYEPTEAKKHLDKLADLIGKAAREHAEAVKILGPSKELGAVFAGLDAASIALTKFRNAFKRKAK